MLLCSVLKFVIMMIIVLCDVKYVLNLFQLFEIVDIYIYIGLIDYNWFVIIMYFVGVFLIICDLSDGRFSRIVFREWVFRSSC